MPSLNTIQIGRYNRALQKLLSLKGPAQVTEIGAEIMAVLPLFWGTENRYLEGWDRFGNALQQASGTGASGVQWRNPSGSNIVAVFEKLTFAVGAAAQQVIVTTAKNNTDQTSAGFTAAFAPFDIRGRINSTLVTSGTNTGFGTNVGTIWLGSNTTAFVPVDIIITDIQEIPLLPGSVLQVVTSNASQALNVNAWWRERFLEDSERA